MPEIQIKQFDQIKLRTTKNIRYLSAPPGVMPDPNGVWTVVGNLGTDLLVSKGAATCKVPLADVYITGRSMPDRLLEKIHGKEGKRSQGPTPQKP